jgi:hypothetical protein
VRGFEGRFLDHRRIWPEQADTSTSHQSASRRRSQRAGEVPADPPPFGVICCFCAESIEPADTDPCRITVETATGKWQVWYCHGICFRNGLTDPPTAPGFFDPAHF